MNPPDLNNPKTVALLKIKQALLDAEEAPLFKYRKDNNYWPVIGEGSHEAKIMFVGEAPGKNEAKTGRPFCGAAGKILDELLAGIGLKREDIYITNIVKDRPPENRDPLPEEIAYYAPLLDQQIEILQPRVIATLGRFSMSYLLTKYFLPASTITEMHGRVIETEEKYGPVTIVPLYHPAAAIYNQHLKDTLKKDFAVLARFK
ncbi:MAG: uracil-DNA glycosylase [Candidatus Paceibacterota bacterium]|jgi:DNA polymerase